MRYKTGFVLLMILLISDLFAGQGKIRISCDKEGAYIYIDGKKKAMTGEGFTTILLDEGEHVVKVVKAIDSHWQYMAQKRVFVGEDTSIKISLKLKRELTEKGITAQKKRWKRVGSIVIDKKQNLMWQDNASARTVERDWSGAKSYCRSLSLDGYSDWKLPSYDELLSIVDYDRYKPAIFSLFKNTASSNYWSSSVNVSYSLYAWDVDFGFGSTNSLNYKTDKGYVRCVRAGQ